MNDTLKQGTKVITNGYPGVIVRHYDGKMYEIRLASGVVCTDDWTLVLANEGEPREDAPV